MIDQGEFELDPPLSGTTGRSDREWIYVMISLNPHDVLLFYRLDIGSNLIYAVAGSDVFLSRTMSEVASAFQG